MKIYLIRHGMTPGNKLRQYIGSTDEPIIESGFSAPKEIENPEAKKKVYVTPLIRTQQTAKQMFPNAEQEIVYGLREIDFGVFEQKSYEDLKDREDYQAWLNDQINYVCPGGESMAMFSERINDSFIEILKDNLGKTDEIIIVCHGGILMGLLSSYGEPHKDFYEYQIKNRCGYMCDLEFTDEEKFEFKLVNLVPIA